MYDIDGDGFISKMELFQILKMMVGSNLLDSQLQQIVDKTIEDADKDHDGKITFDEFQEVLICSARSVNFSVCCVFWLRLLRRMEHDVFRIGVGIIRYSAKDDCTGIASRNKG